MSPRANRMARNAVLFREVNERIAELASGDGFHIVCECANTGCEEKLLVPIDEYERVRQHERWFLIVPGHTATEVEDVVEQHGSFDVVQKHDDVRLS